MDTQNDFWRQGGHLYVPEAETSRPNLARLSQTARQARLAIVASADDHQMSDPESRQSPGSTSSRRSSVSA